jgi:hypothetical protein
LPLLRPASAGFRCDLQLTTYGDLAQKMPISSPAAISSDNMAGFPFTVQITLCSSSTCVHLLPRPFSLSSTCSIEEMPFWISMRSEVIISASLALPKYMISTSCLFA